METRTFRADTLEEALGAVRDQLGPEAIVVRQREGIIGGIGGFFGKRCYEVEAEQPSLGPSPDQVKPSAMPARAVTSAYTSSEGLTSELLEDDDPGDLFRSMIDGSSIFATTLADALEREPAPEPEQPRFEPIALEPIAVEPISVEPISVEPLAVEQVRLEPIAFEQPPEVESAPLPAVIEPAAGLVPVAAASETPMLALTSAGIEARLAETIVAEAEAQLRIFDPHEPFGNQVRELLATRIPTRRLTGGRSRRRVLALIGPPQSGKTSVAARLCAAHAAAGRRVVALSLEPVRATLELGRQTEGHDVELVSADHIGLIEFALKRIAKAEIVIVDTPSVGSRDEDGWARLAMLLRPIEAHETHLVLPGSLLPAGVDAFIGAASEKLRVDRLLLTHLDRNPGPGPAVSAAIRAGIPISATADAERLVPADPYRLAATILP